MVTIQRLISGDKGTFGAFIINDMPRFVSCELPWKNNQRMISCVPAGVYPAVRMVSPHFQKLLYMITDIPGRDAVEIHIGNDITATHGCVLIGMSFGLADYTIVSSGIAFDHFMDMMNNVPSFTITIKDCEYVKTTTIADQV